MNPSAFFEPGRTYARADDPTAIAQIFRCDTVSCHPVTREPHAHGFITRADDAAEWESTSLTAFAWGRGWEDVTPEPAEPDTDDAPDNPAFSDGAFEEIARELQEAGPIWPGELVMYHGEHREYRALYLADVCECEKCDKDDVQYVLLSQDGIPVLRNVRREAITPARIA
ncbi:hypothetical protein [Streptomyces sp. NRRL B-24484]|uniref:hypothetical protein n=1 Tax=Streptomyces sp. NRRL B-24484 TaxID=1463833 RepID=UPI0004BFDE8A|nr:hypothetical protein [Streptomyces sp. NRRL B-24484]